MNLPTTVVGGAPQAHPAERPSGICTTLTAPSRPAAAAGVNANLNLESRSAGHARRTA